MISCPYHAWTYGLDGSLKGAPGFREVESFSVADHGLVELPLESWHGWLFAHAAHPLGHPDVPPFERYVGDLAELLAPYDIGAHLLVRRWAPVVHDATRRAVPATREEP